MEATDKFPGGQLTKGGGRVDRVQVDADVVMMGMPQMAQPGDDGGRAYAG